MLAGKAQIKGLVELLKWNLSDVFECSNLKSGMVCISHLIAIQNSLLEWSKKNVAFYLIIFKFSE